MRHLQHILPLCLAAILAGMAVSSGHRSDAHSPISGARVSLSAVVAQPLDYLGGEVFFSFALESQPETWNPFLTRFGSEDYRALIAWGDEQHLWERAAFDAPAGMLFVRRGNPIEAMLGAAARYSRFEATGIVRQVLGGRPWIEVVALKPLREQFSEGSLIHAARAMSLIEAEHWGLAASSLERALLSPLPERARVELESLRSHCLGQAHRPIGPPVKNRK
jgi:hypothetical protein